MKIMILAGGGGTRLFPVSRTNYPKQFLNVESSISLLAKTVNRYLQLVEPRDILVVTGNRYIQSVREELRKVNALDAHIISEPCPKNTAPAITLAVRFCMDHLSSKGDEEIFVAPSDHIIKPDSEFIEKVKLCAEYSRDRKLVTIGIMPTKPETGYGYIKVADSYKKGFNVEKFVEKPDYEKAISYLQEGCYYWNSGMYAFTIDTYIDELKAHSSELYEYMTTKNYAQFVKDFQKLNSISIDYAVAEKSERIVSVPLDIYWNDVGSWDSLYDYFQKDKDNNVKIGDCKALSCKDSMIISNGRLVAAVGLEDIIVVETSDVIMVAKKGESQRIKEIYDTIKDRNEAHDPATTQRPWGSYTILSQGDGYKVKKIRVLTGESLSLQSHKYRSEHWIVINGQATIVIGGDDERTVRKNESIYVPKETKHRLMNKGTEVLELIEVQNGSYVGEDDIVRYDDVYERYRYMKEA